MTSRVRRTVAAIAGVVIVGAVFLAARGETLVRGAAFRPNPDALVPAIRDAGGVLLVTTLAPAEIIVPDSAPPSRAVRLAWFQGRATTWTPDGDVALDGSGQPIRFDDHLRPRRLHLWLEGRQAMSTAWDGDEGLWVSTAEGSVMRFGWDGALEDSVAHPFDYTVLTSDEAGNVWAVRSPLQFAFPWRPDADPAPLVQPVAAHADVAIPGRQPQVALFEHLVNAGRVVVGPDGSFFFAPFIRDEIVKYNTGGDTVWVASRGLPHGVEHPKFEIIDGEPQLDYAPVNLGLAWGPDGLLYALSTPGHTTSRSRIDALDPETGVVQRSVELDEPLPTVALDETGRLYLLDPFWLLTGAAPLEREAFAPFDLDRLGGGTLSLHALAGKVVLVNFWASWCTPCRVEMPALDSLASTFPADSFAFVALSDDVQPSKAAEFIGEYGFEFPVGFGRGKLQAQYHYFGLPYTVLLDGSGRVIERWTGFTGEQQIHHIASTVRAELERLQDEGGVGHAHGGAPTDSTPDHEAQPSPHEAH